MEKKRKWLKWPLRIWAGIFALLIPASQVSGTQAASNLASWAKLLHLNSLAPLLRAPSVDTWGLVVGIIGVLIPLAIATNYRGICKPLALAGYQPTFVPIWQLVQRVALINGESKDAEFFPKSREIVRQAASDGDLTLRGRRQIGSVESAQMKFDGVFLDIPRAYWGEFKIGPYASVENEYVNNPYTQQITRTIGTRSHYYAELQARRVEMETLWPLPAQGDFVPNLATKKAELEIQLNAARETVRERMSERDNAEAALRDSPSPKTSEAYKIADSRLGEALNKQDTAREELGKLTGVMPKESSYMTGCEVLHYLVDESEWGDRIRAVRVDNNIAPQFPMRKQPMLEAMVEFRRVAEAGSIASFGRKNGQGDLEEIPSVYWAAATLNSLCMYNPTISETMPSDPQPDGISIYKNLRIAREGVYTAWPRNDKRIVVRV